MPACYSALHEEGEVEYQHVAVISCNCAHYMLIWKRSLLKCNLMCGLCAPILIDVHNYTYRYVCVL